MDNPVIQFSKVSKWFGSFQVLADLTFNVTQSEVVVIIGPSGSGKSTLLRCVNGLEPIQEGTLVVDGVNLADRKNLREIRQEIGFVFQSFNGCTTPS